MNRFEEMWRECDLVSYESEVFNILLVDQVHGAKDQETGEQNH